jgi:ubiquinone/menaquinone biosynthesis C-methylase UbiE
MPRRRPHEAQRRRLLERGTSDHYEDAALYDLEYADRAEDVRFYRRLARERAGAGPVLELGAGTGRITCRIAEDGQHVIALDRMQPMLDRLREHAAGQPWADRIEPVLGDMTKVPLPDAAVALVIAPFNALMHLYTWDALLACLREATRVLQPGGTFAFDVDLPDLPWLLWDPDQRHAVTRFTHPTTGERMVYSTNHTYDDATQINHIRLYYDDAPPKGQRFSPPRKPRRLVHLAHRQIFPEEVRLLVDCAGLTLRSHTGDFLGVSLRRGIATQVVVCDKP